MKGRVSEGRGRDRTGDGDLGLRSEGMEDSVQSSEMTWLTFYQDYSGSCCKYSMAGEWRRALESGRLSSETTAVILAPDDGGSFKWN